MKDIAAHQNFLSELKNTELEIDGKKSVSSKQEDVVDIAGKYVDSIQELNVNLSQVAFFSFLFFHSKKHFDD
jgi:hypothetical protein